MTHAAAAPGGTILALSPHLDDAVFSAGAALAAHVDAGWRVVIATLFTGNVDKPTGFALACQLDKGLGPDIDYMALRRAEDLQACALLGAEADHRPLLEAPHRGYGSAPALFAGPREDDPASDALGAEIATLIDRYAPDEVWAPRAIGGHVDHVLLHRAVQRLAVGLTNGPAIVWWTDWPYADRANAADPEAGSVAAADWSSPEANPAQLGRKVEACAAYVSQLGFQFGGEAALRRRLAQALPERLARMPRRKAA